MNKQQKCTINRFIFSFGDTIPKNEICLGVFHNWMKEQFPVLNLYNWNSKDKPIYACTTIKEFKNIYSKKHTLQHYIIQHDKDFCKYLNNVDSWKFKFFEFRVKAKRWLKRLFK